MNRRTFISLLMSSAAAHTLDIDKLLWIPGQKTFFLPPKRIHAVSMSEIIALEMERMLPNIRQLFERDDVFYRALSNHVCTVNAGIEPIIPLNWRKNE